MFDSNFRVKTGGINGGSVDLVLRYFNFKSFKVFSLLLQPQI